jgi:hypothetical protein
VTWQIGKPPVRGSYLVVDCMVGCPYVAYYTKSRGWEDDGGDSLNKWITHWMPLPPMPTDMTSGGAP